MKILALCTTAIGDVMFCTPAIAALSKIASVDVLCHYRRAPLLWHNPHIAKIYTYHNNDFRRARLALQLLPRHYDLVAVLHANDDVKRLLRFVRYHKGYNIQGWREPYLKMTALYRDRATMHSLDLPLMVAEACGAPVPPLEQRTPQIYLTEADGKAAEQWLAQQKVNPAAPLVGMVIGGSAKIRHWPVERFARLAKELSAQHGCEIVVIGSRNEAPLLAGMYQAGAANLKLAFDMDLRLLCAIMARLAVLVTNDTGPMHLAHGLGIGAVALFGVSNPDLIAPRTALQEIICAYDKKAAPGENSMSNIDYDTVKGAVLRALERFAKEKAK